MPLIEWSDSLAVDRGVIDDTHREFVALLNALAEADENGALEALDAFLAHSEAHFGQESRWMEELAYGAAQCHRDEHETVLVIAREVRRRVAAGEGGTDLVRFLAAAVAQWFENHAASMDTVLALYMKEHGYTPLPG
ncbi:MAG TPA: hemerythrin domain-containing protein [Burkholderiales bacterium]|jgi:hemerythrin|nr:hemerythrin domain-containing protein [Burkholderiales bacterium]